MRKKTDQFSYKDKNISYFKNSIKNCENSSIFPLKKQANLLLHHFSQILIGNLLN